MLSFERLADKVHDIGELAFVLQLDLDIAVASEATIGDVDGDAARIVQRSEAHVERQQEAALLADDIDEVRVLLEGDVVPLELLPDIRMDSEDGLPETREEIVHRRARTQMRMASPARRSPRALMVVSSHLAAGRKS